MRAKHHAVPKHQVMLLVCRSVLALTTCCVRAVPNCSIGCRGRRVLEPTEAEAAPVRRLLQARHLGRVTTELCSYMAGVAHGWQYVNVCNRWMVMMSTDLSRLENSTV